MSDDELMAEVEATLNGAMDSVRKDRETEMLRVLRDIVESSQGDGLVPNGQEVLLYLIRQQDIKSLDPDKALMSDELVGKSVEQLVSEGYQGATVSMPFTFESYDNALSNLSSTAASVLADHSQGGRAWASVTCHKEQGTTVYIMVAGNCLSIHKLLPTGDSLASFHDPDTSTADAVEQSLYKHGREIAKAQYEFTAHVQALRAQYPETYSAILKQVLERLGDGDDS